MPERAERGGERDGVSKDGREGNLWNLTITAFETPVLRAPQDEGLLTIAG
jgi:hypothetical protein